MTRRRFVEMLGTMTLFSEALVALPQAFQNHKLKCGACPVAPG